MGKNKEEPLRGISGNLQYQGRSKWGPKGSNSDVSTGEFRAKKVWNSNSGLKFWARVRGFQDLNKWISPL